MNNIQEMWYSICIKFGIWVNCFFSLAVEFSRPNCKHNQLPSGSRKKAAYGGSHTREVPTPHDCGISRGGSRGGLQGAFPRMGSKLPEGHANVRRHLDVLWGVEGYPFGSTAPCLARARNSTRVLALLQNKFVLLCGRVGFPNLFSFQTPHVPMMEAKEGHLVRFGRWSEALVVCPLLTWIV